ncbi:hypothetical protein [Alkalithermobacter paradoxus]|uniref:Uncharacterized protein n=1 Tax=Alkalithermobacter paradoxus TaxID=29349 RepID=A0A1V4I6N0_9FIRM|nr:hypothetical protein CLOTH_14070 [[Clostridium] thermoalcaliphilum]
MNNIGSGFVSYLNTMNNASSNNENALAESQVKSKYYDYIKVDRRLGNYIYGELFEKEKSSAVILTGHAGDGKTSILIQLLYKLGYMSKENKKPLKEEDLVLNKFFYVKDMSELNETKQQEMLKEFLIQPSKNVSSLLISNTGPLLNTFRKVINDDTKFEEFEDRLLKQLDSNNLEDIQVEIGDSVQSFKIVNMAKIDNTYLVRELLTKILQENLWEKCIYCKNTDMCPIAFNYRTCVKNIDRIIDFIERAYTYLKENESRLTVRQMVSHISFALTGNLTCEQINEKLTHDKEALFDYAFPNLFFGYKGIEFIKESYNIKAIKELSKIGIDQISLSKDHSLFVNEDFDMFDDEVRYILENKLRINIESLGIESYNSMQLRRAFRRFYMILSNISSEEFNTMISEIFSDAFKEYYNLMKNRNLNSLERKKLRNLIFDALYKIFLGVYNKNNDILYLTVKKDFDDIQNVQLILGEFNRNNINVFNQSSEDTMKESGETNKLYFRIGSDKRDCFEITYQMLKYFMRINEGEIFTSLNPSFTFGLNKIKSRLLKQCRNENYDSEEIKLLFLNKDNIRTMNILIEDSKLFADS